MGCRGEEGSDYVANGVVVTNYGMVLCVCVVAYIARISRASRCLPEE